MSSGSRLKSLGAQPSRPVAPVSLHFLKRVLISLTVIVTKFIVYFLMNPPYFFRIGSISGGRGPSLCLQKTALHLSLRIVSISIMFTVREPSLLLIAVKGVSNSGPQALEGRCWILSEFICSLNSERVKTNLTKLCASVIDKLLYTTASPFDAAHVGGPM